MDMQKKIDQWYLQLSIILKKPGIVKGKLSVLSHVELSSPIIFVIYINHSKD